MEDIMLQKRALLLRLLPALRKVSVKIVQSFQQYPDESLRTYIGKMASDLNFLRREPLASWIVVDAVNNTFLIPYNIDGSCACKDIDDIPVELQVRHDHHIQIHRAKAPSGSLKKRKDVCLIYILSSPKVQDEGELSKLRELGTLIWTTFNKNHEDKHAKAVPKKLEGNIVEIIENENHIVNKLFSIMAQSEGMVESRRHDVASGGTRHFFNAWRRIVTSEQKIQSMRELSSRRMLRSIMRALQVV